MIRMTEQDIKAFVLQRLESMEVESFAGLEFHCLRKGSKWILILIADKVIAIAMKSQREQTRMFGSLEAAHKVASSIINSMTIIGK
jgi:hypothetical protein